MRDDDQIYNTRNREAASFIHFVRPDLLQAVTRAGHRACNFQFTEPKVATELNEAFYQNAGVDDAMGLLQSSKYIRDAAYAAQNDPSGAWVRDTE